MLSSSGSLHIVVRLKLRMDHVQQLNCCSVIQVNTTEKCVYSSHVCQCLWILYFK